MSWAEGVSGERIPGSQLTILPASHFAWEELPEQFAAIVADWVTRAETGTVRPASDRT